MIIGTGIDIVEIRRIRAVLKRQGERFLYRVFTEAEREYCARHRDPAPCFAARFAVKEAAFKALGTGWARGVTWCDIEVGRKPGQAPSLLIHGEARRIADTLRVRKAHVTLSHAEDAAVACVILES
jgi:holo-[acyl-carrier protein] synthase